MTKVAVIGSGISGLSTAALLCKENVPVTIYEKSNRVGGRTTSMIYRNHILDNGFHIMPFYKTSAVYKILQEIGIEKKLRLAKVSEISFYKDNKFHKYPKGIVDILKMTIIPFSSRITLLRILLPMAFSSIENTEKMDSISLEQITKRMNPETRTFFDAVCMLAFADTPEHVSLGEFARTMIRANPMKGGTSEFAYPDEGGYDRISQLIAEHVQENGAKLNMNLQVKKVVVENGCVKGIVTRDDNFVKADVVVISYPVYIAVRELFDDGVLNDGLLRKTERLNKTTSVVEVHFCLSKKIDTKQIVFPVGDQYTAKGIFFISNITQNVSPKVEHLIMAGTPVSSQDAENPSKIKEIVAKMRKDISLIYPDFEGSVLWERSMAWKLVEAVVKEPGLVWKQKMPHQISEIKGLYFVGDSTVSYGIGTDSAAHSSILCHPKIMLYLKSCTNQKQYEIAKLSGA